MSSTKQRITGVPSRGAVLIGDQSPVTLDPDMMGWIFGRTASFVWHLGIQCSGGWMSDPNPERRARVKDAHAALDRFERQAAAILALVLTLTGVSYAILMQVLL
ncbi:hypothetical protein DC522_01660 [Microvirga sp. KLBC 81]|uniref:hypothetical protein n=1 Tax=Microvirga sp. KLBC 81 TaxID=1862707 RepID=UPI000D513B37|nr:hypothetical protein [Microvirga sp. KLBC 81]PVE25971.1 hypothetical protein DC522_01660 [Microvirga sp. KLBC 81]